MERELKRIVISIRKFSPSGLKLRIETTENRYSGTGTGTSPPHNTHPDVNGQEPRTQDG